MKLQIRYRPTSNLVPLFSFLLLGLLLLSLLLYSKASRFQRFMEPILAISRPKIEFAEKINNLLKNEFDKNNIKGLRFSTDSIIIDKAALGIIAQHKRISALMVLERLGKVLLEILKDPTMIPYIDLIIVNKKMIHSSDEGLNNKTRRHLQHLTEMILNSLYKATPALEDEFGSYFTATAIPIDFVPNSNTWVELRFIPTERLHMDIVQELSKYLR